MWSIDKIWRGKALVWSRSFCVSLRQCRTLVVINSELDSRADFSVGFVVQCPQQITARFIGPA
jgi:hypothetical protein